jgi:Family of unknown function (DUF6152)
LAHQKAARDGESGGETGLWGKSAGVSMKEIAGGAIVAQRTASVIPSTPTLWDDHHNWATFQAVNFNSRNLLPMRLVIWLCAAFAVLVPISQITPTAAHHSYVPKYNPAKKIRLKGVITSVSYFNPHIFFNVDVKTRSGRTVNWRVETESISLARKAGLTQARMPIGGRVTLTGWQSRSGAAEMGLATYRLRRGRRITVRRTPR